MSPISKKYRKSNTLTLARFNQSMGAPILLGILFFFVVCLGASDVIRKTVLAVAIFALLVIAVRFKELRERLHWPFIALTLVVLMDGISTFYAVSGKFALREFLKVFLAYLLAVIMLATSPKKEEITGKRIATLLAVCTAFGSLVSIDLISTRWISGTVTWLLGHFTKAYKSLEGIDPGNTRITSFFTNSNVFAGILGLGILLDLGLADSTESKKERCLFLPLLYINALGFFLTISLGAIAFFGLAAIVLLFMQQKQKRAGLFVLLLEMLLLTAAGAAVISKSSFHVWAGVDPVPLLCALLGAGALYFVDEYIGQKVAPRIAISKMKVIILVIALAILVALFLYLALTLTGDISLSTGEVLVRTVYPKPGTYALEIKAEGTPLYVRIRSRNLQECAMERENIIYNGLADTASFVVPDDSLVIYFDFSTEESTHVISASFEDYKIPLRYKLLPASVAYRLQGVLASHSVIQRIVYFQDGIKLFLRRPIIGLGMGGFENGIKGVQSYAYETKYAHNHYFQTMVETGIVGLLLFLALLAVTAISIWKTRKKHPFVPMMSAALVFVAGQAIHDIVFSAYAYLPVVFGFFVLANLCCGEAIPKPKIAAIMKNSVAGGVAVCTVVYCIFLAGNLYAKHIVEETPTLSALTSAVRLDKFEWADYALPYVTSTMDNDVEYAVRRQADEYAQRLAKVSSNTIPYYLAEYYFNTDRPEEALRMLEKYVNYVASDQNAWQQAFDLLITCDDGSQVLHDGVLRLAELLEDWDANHIGVIYLKKEQNAFIAEHRAQGQIGG